MDKTWRDAVLPASFRGISFLIPQTSVPVGMKGPLHEFPQRDTPFFEQMGKQAQVHKMTAWVVGDDCFERRDKLIEALQNPWRRRAGAPLGWGACRSRSASASWATNATRAGW